jgi:hypothetical protein
MHPSQSNKAEMMQQCAGFVSADEFRTQFRFGTMGSECMMGVTFFLSVILTLMNRNRIFSRKGAKTLSLTQPITFVSFACRVAALAKPGGFVRKFFAIKCID